MRSGTLALVDMVAKPVATATKAPADFAGL